MTMTHPICIIDDDDDVREVMTFALEYEGMAAIKFNRASLALEALAGMTKDQYPALIFVDYLMPEMDGLEFISKLKEKYPKTLGNIPIVLSQLSSGRNIYHLCADLVIVGSRQGR